MGISVDITSNFDYALSFLPESDPTGFAMILVDQEVWDKELIILANLVATVVTKPLRLSVLISCIQETVTVGYKTAVARRPPSTLRTLLRDKRILVVDDIIVNRRVVEGALKKFGAILTCVESGKAASEKLKPPHAFHASTRQVRRVESEANEQIKYGEVSMETFANVSHWHTPILAMTADVIQATCEECMKCGMNGYEEEQLYSAAACFSEWLMV
ncbi:histidine kinase 2 [Tanacetum coccineum]